MSGKELFQNLCKLISIIKLALDSVFKGLCFWGHQFENNQLKENVRGMEKLKKEKKLKENERSKNKIDTYRIHHH